MFLNEGQTLFILENKQLFPEHSALSPINVMCTIFSNILGEKKMKPLSRQSSVRFSVFVTAMQ